METKVMIKITFYSFQMWQSIQWWHPSLAYNFHKKIVNVQ